MRSGVHNPFLAALTSMTSLCSCLNLRRAVWHLRPTTLNEAVDASGKRDLINPAYPCGVQIRPNPFVSFAYLHGCSNLFLAHWLHVHDLHDITLQCA